MSNTPHSKTASPRRWPVGYIRGPQPMIRDADVQIVTLATADCARLCATCDRPIARGRFALLGIKECQCVQPDRH